HQASTGTAGKHVSSIRTGGGKTPPSSGACNSRNINSGPDDSSAGRDFYCRSPLMLRFMPGQDVSTTFLSELQRLKRLVADMEKVAAGMTPEEIAVPEETPTLKIGRAHV